eukprot:UN34876
MHHCREYTQSNTDLVEAMKYALNLIPKNILGSSTCVLVQYNNETNTFHTANMGDSNYLIVRDGEILQKGEIGQVRFNFPYQIG